MLDRERLIKIMGLTTSNSDGEALSALRKANEILAGEKLTWAEVLKGGGPQVTVTVTRHAPAGGDVQTEEWVPPHLKDKVTIDLMFRSIYAQPRTGSEGFWQWLDDIHNRFGKYGQLTQGQYGALRKCYARTLRTA